MTDVFLKIIEEFADGFLILDGQRRVIFFNDVLQRSTGLRSQDIFAREDAFLGELGVLDGQCASHTVDITDRDGTVRQFTVSSLAFESGHGEFTLVRVKPVERQVPAAGSAGWEQLFRNIGDPMFTADLAGRILCANPSFYAPRRLRAVRGAAEPLRDLPQPRGARGQARAPRRVGIRVQPRNPPRHPRPPDAPGARQLVDHPRRDGQSDGLYLAPQGRHLRQEPRGAPEDLRAELHPAVRHDPVVDRHRGSPGPGPQLQLLRGEAVRLPVAGTRRSRLRRDLPRPPQEPCARGRAQAGSGRQGTPRGDRRAAALQGRDDPLHLRLVHPPRVERRRDHRVVDHGARSHRTGAPGEEAAGVLRADQEHPARLHHGLRHPPGVPRGGNGRAPETHGAVHPGAGHRPREAAEVRELHHPGLHRGPLPLVGAPRRRQGRHRETPS